MKAPAPGRPRALARSRPAVETHGPGSVVRPPGRTFGRLLAILAGVLAAASPCIRAAKPTPSEPSPRLPGMSVARTTADLPGNGPTPTKPLGPDSGKNPGAIRLGLVTVDPVSRSVSLPARVNQTNGVLEYALVTEYGKLHESLLATDAGPEHLQAALLLLDLRPSGTNSLADVRTRIPAGSQVQVRVEWNDGGTRVSRPLSDLVALDTREPAEAGHRFLAPGPWLFNGSFQSAEGFAAHFEGSIVSLIRDRVAVLNSGRPDQDREDIHFPATSRLPRVGHPVTVVLETVSPTNSPSARLPTSPRAVP